MLHFLVMGRLFHLTEARIRDFNRRREVGETCTVPERRPSQSLESLPFDEVFELRRQLRGTREINAAETLCQRIQTLETTQRMFGGW